MSLSIGIDVGGTNTDVVVCDLLAYSKNDHENIVISKHKEVTSKPSPMKGIVDGLNIALKDIQNHINDVKLVSIGTTAFLNAIVQRSEQLAHVGVIRLCSQASSALPPFSTMPVDLVKLIYGDIALVDGGYEFNGEVMNVINVEEIKEIALKWLENDIYNIVICGIFSPSNPLQELEVEKIFRDVYKDNELNITLSHSFGELGLLERENASILNACITPLAHQTVDGMIDAIQTLNLNAPLFLTSNQGTLIDANVARNCPILTFSCGPTNSIRGAGFLCGQKDAIICDIGGTTTDVGVLQHGSPVLSNAFIEIEKNIRTNFRMPNVLSFGLGGGSIVEYNDKDNSVVIGPKSVGSNLTTEAKSFGGDHLTMTDVAIRKGLVTINKAKPLKDEITNEIADRILDQSIKMIENHIDMVKMDSKSDLSLIVCGGGSVLVDTNQYSTLKGVANVYKPLHSEVANAIGAAIAQVSCKIDKLIEVKSENREELLESYKNEAIDKLLKLGAIKDKIEVLEIKDVPIAYVKTQMSRLTIRVVGDLDPLQLDKLKNNQNTLKKKSNYNLQKKHTSKFLPPMYQEIQLCNNEKEVKCDYNDQGVWNITTRDIDYIAEGAAILGAGGGGSPFVASQAAKKLLKAGKSIKVIKASSIQNDIDKYVPVAFMGAPVVLIEKLMSGEEVLSSFNNMKSLDPNNIKGLLAAEIGGFNAITPLIVGALTALPCVDADGMGRAFPELQHYHPLIVGKSCTPAVLCDEKNNSVVITSVKKNKWLERIMRIITIEFGAAAALSFPPLTKKDINESMILNTISLSAKIGEAIFKAKEKNQNVFDAIINAYYNGCGLKGKVLLSGKIADVQRITESGFNKGKIKIAPLVSNSSEANASELIVHFQNENLAVFNGDAVLACVPDIITVLDLEKGTAITTESIKYGLRVALIVLEAPPQLCTEQALNVVGPKAFGFENIEYKPILS